MRGFKRVFGVAIAAGLLAASAIHASAATSNLEASVSPQCVVAGQSLAISIDNVPAGTTFAIRLTYSTSNLNGVVYASAFSPAGTFTKSITVPAGAVGNASLAIVAAGSTTDAIGFGSVTVAALGGCPSPGITTIALDNSIAATSSSVAKTCASGVSGNATFTVTAGLSEAGTFEFPDLVAPCNGPAVPLPALLARATLVLHEKTVPSGGVAAADVSLTIPPSANPITINNPRAANTATPSPTPAARVLPQTGGGTPRTSNGPWVAGALVGLMVLLSAAVRLRSRRTRRVP